MTFDATQWFPDELKFLKDNYYNLTNDQLLEHVNRYRSHKMKKSSMLHQCRRMGLRREIQIRWSAEDTKWLRKVYLKYGDTELAIRLNKRYSTYRIINGKKVFRKFTKKHVEKKRSLLGLRRSEENVRAIVQRNQDIGLRTGYFTSGVNKWTENPELAMKEGDTTIQKNGKFHRKMIKIDGTLIPYHRWWWINFVGPLTSGQYVMFKDFDQTNSDPDNLYVSTHKRITKERRFEGVELLKRREQALILKLRSISRVDERAAMAELARLRKLIKHFAR